MACRVASAPALLRSLPADAEPGTDLRPGVAEPAQPADCLPDGPVDVIGQRDQIRQRLDVTGADPPAVRPYHAAHERGELVVLNRPATPVWCQGRLDSRLRHGAHADRPVSR